MFTEFVTAFYGEGVILDDFDKTFALFTLLLMVYGLSEVIAAIMSFVKH